MNGSQWCADLQGEDEQGEFEIYVAFQDCFGKSQAYTRGLKAGFEHSPPGCSWSSDTPRRPVGMRYTLGRIRAIYDNEAGYNVYERKPAD